MELYNSQQRTKATKLAWKREILVPPIRSIFSTYPKNNILNLKSSFYLSLLIPYYLFRLETSNTLATP